MKRHDIKAEKNIDGNKFYIRPFGAFTAANLSGEITALIMPALGQLAPLVGKGRESGVFDVDVAEAAPVLAQGLSGISGNRLEELLKRLLVKHNNISVELKDGSEIQTLTEELADEVFCGEAQGMFMLALEVIRANYSGFFGKPGGRFGEALAGLQMKG